MKILFVSSMVILLAGSPAFAGDQQKPASVPAAPVPSQILSGKKVFISNAGEENLNIPIGSLLSGSSERVYNQFYAAVQKLGRYELVSAPADADLIFEIGFTINGSASLPEIGHLRLSIRDPKTNVLLWTLVEYAQAAILKGNRDRNLNQAMTLIVGELRALVTPPAPSNS